MPGTLSVCGPQEYTFKAQVANESRYLLGRICFPSLSSQLCLPSGKHDVVMIFHADKTLAPNVDYLMYDPLMQHIASHGYVVISVARCHGASSMGPWEKTLLGNTQFDIVNGHIAWLYGQSMVKLNVANSISMIMHSAGGNYLRTLASVGQAGKSLKALITFTPAFVMGEVPQYNITTHTKAYLGLHTTPDWDPASGHVMGGPNALMETCFALYDLWDETIGFAKDTVFLQGSPPGDPTAIGHYYQNTIVAKAYATAFLGFHSKGIAGYADIFRLGVSPGTLKAQEPQWIVRQQHGHIDASFFLRLCEFRIPGTFSFITTPFVQNKVGAGYTLNRWCPHGSHVAWFRYQRGQHVRIIVYFATTSDISAYKYLSFRMGQVFDIDLGIVVTPPLQIKVGINTQTLSQMSTIVLPTQIAAQITGPKEIKSVMQTFVIPLSNIQGVNLSAVKSVFFDFTASSLTSETGAVIIASIEAWK